MFKSFVFCLISILMSFTLKAQNYAVEITEEDTFAIRYTPESEIPPGSVFQFAKTVPGVYSTIDFGKLVVSVKGINDKGEQVALQRLSDNEWQMPANEDIQFIDYEIDDSYGSVRHPLVPFIAGTSIEPEHIMLNTIGVLGYIHSLNSNAASLSLKLPENWTIGTALARNENILVARDFYELAETPIMAGILDSATVMIKGTNIELFSFSSSGNIKAQQLLKQITPALTATNQFVKRKLVDRYVFLVQLLDKETKKRNNIRGIGALEHATSSSYILSDDTRILSIMNEWVAHEYFHIVTPLSLHSKNVRPFAYHKNNPDSFLWLYEGFTVWASEIILLRDKQITNVDYFKLLKSKFEYVEKSKINKSLADISKNIYSVTEDYGLHTFDNHGALTMFCIDVNLLSQSQGRSGLRELLLAMLEHFDKDRSFNQAEFYKVFERYAGADITALLKQGVFEVDAINFNQCLELIGYEITAGDEIQSVESPSKHQTLIMQAWSSDLNN